MSFGFMGKIFRVNLTNGNILEEEVPDEWNKQLEEAGIENPILSPILLPDYTRKVR